MGRDSWEAWVTALADRDWRRAGEAEARLAAAGAEGLAAVIGGLAHAEAPIRRACARFMDHHGSDEAVPALARALRDPVPRVRREAVHSLGCQRCKATPLTGDLLPLLIDRLDNDDNARVRREAIYAVGQRPPDARTRAALRRAWERETAPDLRRAAHVNLRLHDPAYRAETDARARAGPRREGEAI